MSATRLLVTGAVLAWALAAGPPAAAQPAAPFSLADALARALAESPDVASAQARVDAARLAVPEASRLPNPVAEFRSENWASGVSRSVLPLDTFAEVTQVIEIGGKRGARTGVAEARLGAEEATTALTRQDLARSVAQAYLAALRHRDRHRALTAQAADLAESVRVMERRVEVGATAESELLKLRTEEARAAVETLRAGVSARAAVVALGAQVNAAPTLDALLPPVVPVPGMDDESAAVARRPDVAAARQALESARQASRLERARGVPDPAVNAGLKRTTGLNTAQMTVTMPIPLFNRNQAARLLAEGEVRAATLALAATERRARGELAGARETARQLADRATEARRTLIEPARAARDAARAAFAAGALDVLRLVDAERVFADATLVTIDLEIDALLAAIDARLAAGEDPLP